MTRHIVLDSSPAGLLTQPQPSPSLTAINNWATACLAAGHVICLPEIIDYELRRELIRAGKTRGLARLDAIKAAFRYLPLDTPTMLRAADLWAQARQTGQTTAAPQKLDVDVILAAQAVSLGLPDADFADLCPPPCGQVFCRKGRKQLKTLNWFGADFPWR